MIRDAIIGALLGTASLAIWAAVTHAFSPLSAAELGFVAGTCAGAAAGAVRSALNARD
jgi:hypothetical protein